MRYRLGSADERSPPRPRGLPHSEMLFRQALKVSPAPAGIALVFDIAHSLIGGLPRARGDCPHHRYAKGMRLESPPRPRGLPPFLFQKLLDFICLPRARGDCPELA